MAYVNFGTKETCIIQDRLAVFSFPKNCPYPQVLYYSIMSSVSFALANIIPSSSTSINWFIKPSISDQESVIVNVDSLRAIEFELIAEFYMRLFVVQLEYLIIWYIIGVLPFNCQVVLPQCTIRGTLVRLNRLLCYWVMLQGDGAHPSKVRWWIIDLDKVPRFFFWVTWNIFVTTNLDKFISSCRTNAINNN